LISTKPDEKEKSKIHDKNNSLWSQDNDIKVDFHVSLG